MEYLPNKGTVAFWFFIWFFFFAPVGFIGWYDLEPTRKQASNARSGSLLCMHIYLPIGCVNTLR